MRVQATCLGDIFDAEGDIAEVGPLYNAWLILQASAIAADQQQGAPARAPAPDRELH